VAAVAVQREVHLSLIDRGAHPRPSLVFNTVFTLLLPFASLGPDGCWSDLTSPFIPWPLFLPLLCYWTGRSKVSFSPLLPPVSTAASFGCVQIQNILGKYFYSTFVVIWQNLSNHELIRLKRFISTFTDKLYN
jgi:hypothetical protein